MVTKKNHAVVGVFAGDEGKGKIVDVLAADVRIVVRCGGGANAGYTVQIGDTTFVGHLLPSGVAQDTICALGRGVRIDPKQLGDEIHEVRRIFRRMPHLWIDEGAFLIVPTWHRALEWWAERAKVDRRVGTTGKGIGPCEATIAFRVGPKVHALLTPGTLREELEVFYRMFAPIFQQPEFAQPREEGGFGQPIPGPEAVAEQLLADGRQITEYLTDVRSQLYWEWKIHSTPMLFEGAQGLMLGSYWGTYGYNTASRCTYASLADDCGLPIDVLGKRVGVVKAIATRVGGGPLPSECGDPVTSEDKVVGADRDKMLVYLRDQINSERATNDEIGRYFRVLGHEYGATTGRPRRCGWLDLAWLRYFCQVNEPHALALTKLDCLSGLRQLKVCLAYNVEGHASTETPPASTDEFASVTPNYAMFNGWSEDITGETRFSHLPLNARAYVEFLEKMVRCPVTLIGTGPERGHLIRRNP